MKANDLIVVSRSALETALNVVEKTYENGEALGASESFNNGVNIGLIALKSVYSTHLPLVPLLEKTWNAAIDICSDSIGCLDRGKFIKNNKQQFLDSDL